MKITNHKIKKIVRESLRRILFESEDELDRLKAEFNRKVEELGQSKTAEEFNRRNAEIQELEKRINSLTRTMFKEPEEPGEFDFMQSDPIEYPVPYQSGDMTPYEDDIDPLDRPAILDVDEVDMYPGGPMTQREKNRRDFIRDSVLGTAGVAYTLGKAAQHSSIDPRLQIASDWFDQAFYDGTWDSFIYNRYISSNEFSSHLFPNFDSLPIDEQKALIADYVMDYAPEELYEALGTKWEAAGYQDPGETGEMDVYNQLSDLIYRKLQRYYTPEKIKELRSGASSSTSIYEDPHSITAAKFAQLNDAEVKKYVRAYVDMEMEYTHKDRLKSAESLHVIGDITDEITDNMVHQILEDENAGNSPMYEKLYDSLVGLVENFVERYHMESP